MRQVSVTTLCLHQQFENMISSIVKTDTLSQMSEVFERLDGYDAKFAKQERVIGELQRANENLQRTNENLMKRLAGLTTNVARVSYTSSL